MGVPLSSTTSTTHNLIRVHPQIQKGKNMTENLVGTEPFVDEDLVAETAASGTPTVVGSPLEALKMELKQSAVNEPITLRITNRPNFSIRFSTNIDSALLDVWQQRSVRRKNGRQIGDPVKFSALVIANQCEAILYHGEEHAANGMALNFRNPALKEMLGLDSTTNATEVVRALFGSDGSIISAASSVTLAAGYGEESEVTDEDDTPTQ